MKLDKNTKVNIGCAVTVAIALATFTYRFANLEAAIRSAWSIENQQDWTDEARKLNPSVFFPNPQEIKRKRAPISVMPGGAYSDWAAAGMEDPMERFTARDSYGRVVAVSNIYHYPP